MQIVPVAAVVRRCKTFDASIFWYVVFEREYLFSRTQSTHLSLTLSREYPPLAIIPRDYSIFKHQRSNTGIYPKSRLMQQYFLDRYVDTFDDFAELIIQFGYVTLFAVAFPLSPLFALVNNYFIERWLDRTKLLHWRSRPRSSRCSRYGNLDVHHRSHGISHRHDKCWYLRLYLWCFRCGLLRIWTSLSVSLYRTSHHHSSRLDRIFCTDQVTNRHCSSGQASGKRVPTRCTK